MSQNLRNVCLISHGGTGKTSLAEAILYNAGVLDRLGKVNDGNTTMDYDPEETKRNISISMSVACCDWKDHKFNIIDTPGYFDFVGEVYEGVRVADACLIPVSAKSGNQAGIEKAWAFAKENNIPKIFFINKLDEQNTKFTDVMDGLYEVYGKTLVPFMLPLKIEGRLKGYVDVVNKVAYEFKSGTPHEIDVPEELKSEMEKLNEKLLEAVAETSEELLEKYLEGEELTHDEIIKGLDEGILDGSLSPVFCGSATENFGIRMLMDAMIDYLPSPDARGIIKAKKANNEDEIIELKPESNEKTSAIVFKTIADPFVGKLSIFRVYSGVVTPSSTLYNSSQDETEKIGHVFYLRGKKQIETDKVEAGDIGAIAKLQYTRTGDTLCNEDSPVKLERVDFPNSEIFLAVEPKSKGDEEKISSGLNKLMEEDPTIKLEHNSETHEQLLHGMGEQHLDVIVSKLKNKFNTEVELKEPKIPYRETIQKKVKVEGKHKKQSGGHGQYGHVWMEFEPGQTEDLTFEETIFGGSVPKQYIPAVEKGLKEALHNGVLAGYPVVNLKATLVDGSYHDVDSSEMAFKLAANIAFKKGLEQASPALLEPIMKVEVLVPESYMGDIIGDLNKRRGRILGMNPAKNKQQKIEAEVPLSEMFKYSTDLRSMTQGRGRFIQTFERYEQAPPNISQKVVEEYKRSKEE